MLREVVGECNGWAGIFYTGAAKLLKNRAVELAVIVWPLPSGWGMPPDDGTDTNDPPP